MRVVPLRLGLAVLFGLALALTPRPALAQDHVEPPIVTVEYKTPDGHEHERKFDLNEPEQYQEVLKLLKEDRVVHITKAEPVDILALRWDLALWTVVVFTLLYFILRNTAWKPMLEGLQRREENIHGALTEAQKARDEARALRDSLKLELDKASDKVREMYDTARRDSQKLTDEMLAKAQAEITAKGERLRHELQVEKDAALQELWSHTAQLATLVSARTLRRQLTSEDHRQLVDQAVNEMRGAAADARKDVWKKL